MANLREARDYNGETLQKGDVVEAAPDIGRDWWVSGMTLGVVKGISSSGFCDVDIKRTTNKNRDVLGLHVAPSRCLAKIHSDIEVQPSEALLNMSFMY